MTCFHAGSTAPPIEALGLVNFKADWPQSSGGNSEQGRLFTDGILDFAFSVVDAGFGINETHYKDSNCALADSTKAAVEMEGPGTSPGQLDQQAISSSLRYGSEHRLQFAASLQEPGLIAYVGLWLLASKRDVLTLE